VNLKRIWEACNLKSGKNVGCEILKVAHHISFPNVPSKFIKKVLEPNVGNNVALLVSEKIVWKDFL
jgi:hypothetical protein